MLFSRPPSFLYRFKILLNPTFSFWIGMHVKQPTIAYSRHNNIWASEWLLFIAKGAMVMEILPYRDIECMINFDPNKSYTLA
jgi:hypothetical protein